MNDLIEIGMRVIIFGNSCDVHDFLHIVEGNTSKGSSIVAASKALVIAA